MKRKQPKVKIESGSAICTISMPRELKPIVVQRAKDKFQSLSSHVTELITKDLRTAKGAK